MPSTSIRPSDDELERQRLVEECRELDRARDDWIREAVLVRRRADVLAAVLGYKLKPFHKALQRHALRHKRTLHLAFRGGGKSTALTIVLTVLEVLINPDTRILIASKTHALAKDILREIKAHLESDRITELFGPQRGDKWDTSEIVVAGRSRPMKESTVTTVGTEGQVIGKHYDKVFGDDLVDEDNSRTRHGRDKLKTFWYKVLVPTFRPGSSVHVVGTRYHYEDLYGHLAETDADFKNTTQIIPALDDEGRSPWPENFPPEHFEKLKRSMGTVIYESQYECKTDKMRGDVFEFDWMPVCPRSAVPKDAKIYIGVDLAASQSSTADYFAIVAIAKLGRQVWILDALQRRLSLRNQIKTIVRWFDRFDPVEVGIESNAYQTVLADTIRDEYPRVRVRKIFTKIDKVTRGFKLAQRFEAGEVTIVDGLGELIDHLVGFTGKPGERDDLFDAVDHAFRAAFRRRRRRGRETEPGLI